ncbi:MAG: WYL domain-containing protein [Gimesia sp.]
MVVGRINRLLKLIALLQSGRVYNSAQLAKECDVSRRTVFRDLSTLQESGIYVLYDDEKQGYTLPWRTITPFKDLTSEEVLSLLVLCQDLDKTIIGLPLHQLARSASTKILSSLPDPLRENVINAAQSLSIAFPAVNPTIRNKIHYKNLFKAAIEKKNVRIQIACSKGQKTVSTMLSPYHILYSNRQWFVVGRSSIDRGIKAFSLSKIQNSEILDESFKKPSRFNPFRYLSLSWDPFHHSRKPIPVKIRFESSVADSVSLSCWDPSQELKKLKGGAIEFRAEVDSLEHIADWVLGFGDQAEVLSPRSFRKLVKERISNMFQIYDS